MPMGYETRIVRNSLEVSGSGFRWRARWAGERPIVLLDEATRHLDTINENLIERMLTRSRCSTPGL